MFFLVITLVLGLLNWRAHRWLTSAFRLGKRAARAIAVVLGGSWLFTAAGRFASLVGYEWPDGIFVAAFAVQLAVLISVGLLLPYDLVRGARGLYTRVGRGRVSSAASGQASETTVPQQEESLPPSTVPVEREAGAAFTRREFAAQVAVGSAFLIGGGSATYGALVGRHDYVVEEVPVRLPGLSRSFDGFSIVQLSDLHIGQFIQDAELAAAEALVRQARPDLIVLTGDLVDHDPRFAERLGRFARQLGPLARYGVSAVSGNHDYYAGITPVLDALRRGGARVLRNEAVVLGDLGAGIALLGVDDVRATRYPGERGPDLARAVDSLPALGGRVSPARDLPRVLLCHNPVYFEAAQGQVGLQLSGHTHGGQVNPLVRPADWVLRHGWIAGSYEAQGSHLYVNRGFGTAGPPARVAAPPEVTRIVLTV
ncbi:MAG TPA: metallophosphoesterase [Polyangiaceae bacterium]|nr:metallophosphoesterase [Polyangiaceae bacterium]